MTQRPGHPVSRAGSLPLVGGALALDFCNTTSGLGTEQAIEHLNGVEDLLAWARHADAFDPALEALVSDPGEAGRTTGPALIERIRRFRQTIYNVSAALAAGRTVGERDLEALATVYAQCLSKGRLVARGATFAWTWSRVEGSGEAILGPIASSAMNLLMQADRSRLKQCPGRHCGWLFLDQTKNKSRRWCEMEVCGNRAKQQRHQGRRRAAETR